jgi:GT2 family glycosyltransferase
MVTRKGSENDTGTFNHPTLTRDNSLKIMQPRVWIVIPNFNGLALTRSCLADLSRQSYPYITVVVSDSGSTDGTYQIVAKEFPAVIILRGNSEWWWTKATNEGVKYALDHADAHDYIMTLNNDVVVPEDYVAEMVSLARQYPMSIIGSAIYDISNADRLVECGSYTDWRTMKYHLLSPSEFDQTGTCKKLTFLCGKGVLYAARVFREHGLFDESALPHYGADQDFVAKCKKHGYVLRVQTRVPLYSREDITAPGARDTTRWIDKLKLLFIRKSKLNVAVHMRLMFRHCPKYYWLTSGMLLLCRLLGHIYVNKGMQRGPRKKLNVHAHS